MIQFTAHPYKHTGMREGEGKVKRKKSSWKHELFVQTRISCNGTPKALTLSAFHPASWQLGFSWWSTESCLLKISDFWILFLRARHRPWASYAILCLPLCLSLFLPHLLLLQRIGQQKNPWESGGSCAELVQVQGMRRQQAWWHGVRTAFGE